MKCLQETGVIPELGRFKPKDIDCPHCNKRIIRHEEKETDVAIAMKLSEILISNKCDTVVLVTGDTDLTPAIKTTKRLFPDKAIIFAFPYRRSNAELAQIAPGSFKIHKGSYVRHQFPSLVVLRNGTYVEKPNSW